MNDVQSRAVGQLVALSLTSVVTINTNVVRRVADIVAIDGIAAGRGFINGVWYIAGNTRTTLNPYGLNATWKCVLAILAD